MQRHRKRKERKKAKQDPVYAFNVKQKALLSKGDSRLKKIEEELQYNKKELENCSPHGLQAKVFETRIKQLTEEEKKVNEGLDKIANANPGDVIDESDIGEIPPLLGLPQPVSDVLYGLIGIAGVLVIGGFLFSGCSALFSGGSSDTARQWECEDKIKATMHDPWSYKYISGTKTDTTVTIKFKGKNAFGAYVTNYQTCSN